MIQFLTPYIFATQTLTEQTNKDIDQLFGIKFDSLPAPNSNSPVKGLSLQQSP